jgi:hypothetical protein
MKAKWMLFDLSLPAKHQDLNKGQGRETFGRNTRCGHPRGVLGKDLHRAKYKSESAFIKSVLGGGDAAEDGGLEQILLLKDFP